MKVGITGGIGSGKSYICNLLKDEGYQIYSCDDEAKRLMVTNADIIQGLKTLIGDDAYTSDGELNKTVIAQFLFSDKDNGQKVNDIVHPVVKADFLRWAKEVESQNDSNHKNVPIMECAILFESGFDSVVDKTVLIWAKKNTRLQRAMKRDSASKEQILARMAAQISGKEACERADFIFHHESYDETESEMQRLLNFINNC